MEPVDTQESLADKSVRSQAQPHPEHESRCHADRSGREGHHHDEPMGPEEAVRSLLLLGQVALDARDYESAMEAFASILKIEQNEVALYNLGSFYARGLGVKRDYMEAARLFHQAELMGNERAGKLCGKCMYDYAREGLAGKEPVDVYAAMAVYVSRVYPEAADQKLETNHGLVAVASTLLSRGDYSGAAKVFRAAAEFGDDGYAQYYLGLLYNAGAGLPHDDLAALHWLELAAGNGVEDATTSRNGILDAYRQALSDQEFQELMAQLSQQQE